MNTTQKILPFLNNKLTHCVYCKSTILWYPSGKFNVLQSGNDHVFECLKHGCALVTHTLPEQYSSPHEIGSFLLSLINDGIPVSIAESAALNLISVTLAA